MSWQANLTLKMKSVLLVRRLRSNICCVWCLTEQNLWGKCSRNKLNDVVYFHLDLLSSQNEFTFTLISSAFRWAQVVSKRVGFTWQLQNFSFNGEAEYMDIQRKWYTEKKHRFILIIELPWHKSWLLAFGTGQAEANAADSSGGNSCGNSLLPTTPRCTYA